MGGRQIRTSSLSVSRYHRLGGGDIDRAIVYEVLVPELIKQNELPPFSLKFDEKKKFVEPALLGIAEALKISLCIEIARLRKFGKWLNGDKSPVVATIPGEHSFAVNKQMVKLQSPKLSAAQFEKLLVPFLDWDFLYARETEYRMTCSVFAPLQDALDRCGLDHEAVDLCLLTGGSTLIPQIVDTVQEFFPAAELLQSKEHDGVHTAVARGAAYHALAKEIFGKGVIQPVCHDDIAIRASGGVLTLVPKGAELPFPAADRYEIRTGLLVPPKGIFESSDLKIEIVAGDEQRLLFSATWPIPRMANVGDPLTVLVRYDESQILHLRLGLADDSETEFSVTLSNPLTHVVNSSSKRAEIDELEEQLRTGGKSASDAADIVVKIAKLYAELGQYEKGLAYLRRALKAKGHADPDILNEMASCAGRLGDRESQEKFYREAAVNWNGAWFNLALAQKARGRVIEAIQSVERAISVNREAPYLVLRAMLAKPQQNESEASRFLSEALKIFAPLKALNDWELGWFLTAAQLQGDQEKIAAAKAEQQARNRGGEIGHFELLIPRNTSDVLFVKNAAPLIKCTDALLGQIQKIQRGLDIGFQHIREHENVKALSGNAVFVSKITGSMQQNLSLPGSGRSEDHAVLPRSELDRPQLLS
jgi:tetratricopeptide (TPR) repeat protein